MAGFLNQARSFLWEIRREDGSNNFVNNRSETQQIALQPRRRLTDVKGFKAWGKKKKHRKKKKSVREKVRVAEHHVHPSTTRIAAYCSGRFF